MERGSDGENDTCVAENALEDLLKRSSSQSANAELWNTMPNSSVCEWICPNQWFITHLDWIDQ